MALSPPRVTVLQMREKDGILLLPSSWFTEGDTPQGGIQSPVLGLPIYLPHCAWVGSCCLVA